MRPYIFLMLLLAQAVSVVSTSSAQAEANERAEARASEARVSSWLRERLLATLLGGGGDGVVDTPRKYMEEIRLLRESPPKASSRRLQEVPEEHPLREHDGGNHTGKSYSNSNSNSNSNSTRTAKDTDPAYESLRPIPVRGPGTRKLRAQLLAVVGGDEAEADARRRLLIHRGGRKLSCYQDVYGPWGSCNGPCVPAGMDFTIGDQTRSCISWGSGTQSRKCKTPTCAHSHNPHRHNPHIHYPHTHAPHGHNPHDHQPHDHQPVRSLSAFYACMQVGIFCWS